MLLRPGTRALTLSRADLVLLPEGQWTGDLLSRTIARRSVDGALGRASLEVIPKTLFFPHTSDRKLPPDAGGPDFGQHL